MSQNFHPGDFLVFQLEAGFALLRLLAVDETEGEKTWHVAGYSDFFLDVDSAETASAEPAKLAISNPHMALNNRAFEATQVAKLSNVALVEHELAPLDEWRNIPDHEVSDRSVRLMLGFR